MLQHVNDQVGILSDHIISFRASIADFCDLFRRPVTGNGKKVPSTETSRG
ncbi:hypothetical protein ACFRFU_52380 [Streptomyces sp. NPDC056704]